MSNDNNKISVKQAMIFIIIVFCAPAIRYIPLYSSQQAKQAAWLAPLVALFFQIVYVLIWCKVIKKYGSKSFVDITKDILGKIIGITVIIIYFIWITFFLAYNVRLYAERILAATRTE
jgi:spore germination protein KB